MLGPQIGMGPIWLQGGRFKKCDELTIDSCDTTITDGCCVVIPCALCLVWRVYGEDDRFGKAAFDPAFNKYHGTVAGAEFFAYWQKNESGICELKVEFDGIEVATLTCDDVSCRSPEGSVETSLDYVDGTLEWTVQTKRPINYIKTDDGCTDFFCGTCECTCEELCVTIKATTSDPAEVFFLEGKDVIPLISYTCDGPEWLGSVETTLGALTESIEVYVYLYRDSYTGECWMTGEARGQELTPRRILYCAGFEERFELYDGSIVTIRCKECDCNDRPCEFCCLPMDFSQPEYPGGVLTGIPYSISGCDIDEYHSEGSFVTSPGNLPCTDNAIYYGPTWSTPSQTMYVDGVAADGSCATTPCFNTFRLLLECTDRFLEPGDDDGCDRLWLWVGSANPQVGDIGEEPPDAGGFGGIVSWVRYRAESCTCDDVGGVAAAWSFDITIDCSENPFGSEYGPCAGVRLSCCEYTCSGTVTI